MTSGSFFVCADDEKTTSIGRFEIVGYDVQGNTLIPVQEVNQMLSPFVGKDKDFGSIQRALETLESAYRKKGFSVVQVVLPEQEINRGVVQLRVVEIKLGQVSVTGNTFFDEANIKRSFPTLQEGRSPNTQDISRNLKLANENPAKKSTIQLQSEKQDGSIDATIQVTDQKPWAAAVSIDNTGDPNSGRNRVTGSFQYADIGGVDHVLNLQYTTSISQPDNATILGLGYHIPFYSLGDSLDLYAVYSNVDQGTVNVGDLGYTASGNGTIYGMRYNHNFLKKGNYDSTLSAGLEQKVLRNNISFFDTPFGNEITVHPVNLTYTGNWAISDTAVNFGLSAVHNFSGGEHGSNADFQKARFGAEPNYNLLRYNANFGHAFSNDWQIRFILTGQATSDALVPGEQFGVGGATSVRGFYERELIDDKGRTTNLELYTPDLCSGTRQCRLLSFYDNGYLSRNNALPGEKGSTSVASVGLGFRFVLSPQWSAQADWAHVLEGTTLSPAGSNRVHFKLIMTF